MSPKPYRYQFRPRDSTTILREQQGARTLEEGHKLSTVVARQFCALWARLSLGAQSGQLDFKTRLTTLFLLPLPLLLTTTTYRSHLYPQPHNSTLTFIHIHNVDRANHKASTSIYRSITLLTVCSELLRSSTPTTITRNPVLSL